MGELEPNPYASPGTVDAPPAGEVVHVERTPEPLSSEALLAREASLRGLGIAKQRMVWVHVPMLAMLVYTFGPRQRFTLEAFVITCGIYGGINYGIGKGLVALSRTAAALQVLLSTATVVAIVWYHMPSPEALPYWITPSFWLGSGRFYLLAMVAAGVQVAILSGLCRKTTAAVTAPVYIAAAEEHPSAARTALIAEQAWRWTVTLGIAELAALLYRGIFWWDYEMR